ncbi:MAG: cell division protein FtsZ [Deltaproteobacteria bacterium]|nr:MAG: cell division protein FtsZ [Deltaproteobacteria bacterium]
MMRYEIVEESPSAKIKVFGVGGAGGNAVNNMIAAGLKGVDFKAANTDKQALDFNSALDKLQLGANLTHGLGAGADPEIGALAAEESIESIRAATQDADMIFITAGMGGGTGTGASPIIARESRNNGALTVAVVTKPFEFEGEKRMKAALDGIEKLKKQVDTLLIIPNQRLRALGNADTPFLELMKIADDVLLYAVKGISDLITIPGFINLDFADVRRVMEQMGTALMGTGTASGENRALEAAQMAINSPLLEDISIDQARGVLINMTGSTGMTMEEVMEGSSFIKNEVHHDAEIIWGMVFDDTMADEMRITVIATGISKTMDKKIINLRDLSPEEMDDNWTVRVKEDLDKPTFQRQLSEEDTDLLIKDKDLNSGKRGILKRVFQKENLEYPTFLRKQAD